eukprot:11580162-Heterocapsa_arctica.AAC.1
MAWDPMNPAKITFIDEDDDGEPEHSGTEEPPSSGTWITGYMSLERASTGTPIDYVPGVTQDGLSGPGADDVVQTEGHWQWIARTTGAMAARAAGKGAETVMRAVAAGHGVPAAPRLRDRKQ